MRVLLFNALGLAAKHETLLQFITEHQPNVTFITETYGSTFGRPFLNISKPDHRHITGGRRQNGGIAGWLLDPSLNNTVRSLHTDPACNFSIVQFQGITFAIGYFPPTTVEDSALIEFLNLALQLAPSGPLVILGDFNARMTIAGDHTSNARGSKLADWLAEHHEIDLPQPSAGRYTSFGWDGRGSGVTDLVLTRDTTAQAYVIHENETLGGSDHRPILFELPDGSDESRSTPSAAFSRWNIAKLPDTLDTYLEILQRHAVTVQEEQTASLTVQEHWIRLKE